MAASVTLFELAQRFSGISELPGKKSNPFVLAMLRLDADWPEDDEVPWCSAYVNFIAWMMHLPRSKSLRARSWLEYGVPVTLHEARRGDVVVLKRGTNPAQGHVGFYAGMSKGTVINVLGGNQANRVSIADFSTSHLLALRRLDPD